MKFSTAISVAALAAAASAQTQITDLPQCALNCMLGGIGGTGCSLTDFGCACANDPFIAATAECIAETCGAAAGATIEGAAQFCLERGVNICKHLPAGCPDEEPEEPVEPVEPEEPEETPAPAEPTPIPDGTATTLITVTVTDCTTETPVVPTPDCETETPVAPPVEETPVVIEPPVVTQPPAGGNDSYVPPTTPPPADDEPVCEGNSTCPPSGTTPPPPVETVPESAGAKVVFSGLLAAVGMAFVAFM